MLSRRDWDLVVIGGINTDYVVLGRELPPPGTTRDGSTFLAGPGGKGANAAVAASRLGPERPSLAASAARIEDAPW